MIFGELTMNVEMTQMSRSRKKNPIGWICCTRPGEMKKWKSKQNRNLRRTIEELPSGAFYKRKSEIWNSPGDAKTCFDHPFYEMKPWKCYGK